MTSPNPQPLSPSEDDDLSVTEKSGFFSSQAPEASQSFALRANDHSNFSAFPPDRREQAIADVSRLILFRGMTQKEPIDRLECVKTANLPANISTAVLQAANERLNNCFGFQFQTLPENHLSKLWSKKYKDRAFLINCFNDVDGTHSKALHSVHDDLAVEKGFLMVVLSLIYCEGKALASDKYRWLGENQLYECLNKLDERLPSEPPKANTKRGNSIHSNESVTNGAPNVDRLLEQFVKQDYLVKINKVEALTNGDADDRQYYYSMGPRAALTIGRKQIIYFCAEVCDVEPDPLMLQELEEEDLDHMETQPEVSQVA